MLLFRLGMDDIDDAGGYLGWVSCKTNACEGKDGQSEEDRKGEIQAGLHLLSSSCEGGKMVVHGKREKGKYSMDFILKKDVRVRHSDLSHSSLLKGNHSKNDRKNWKLNSKPRTPFGS
nr:hypothetical protein Iba_chr02eCG8900 [Ipomoea batatas]GMD90155.1 hypothetical protein Iba_chr14dCG6940 [Ipomoea batatas]